MNTSHYPSLELCERLTEAGFKETEFLYAECQIIGNTRNPMITNKAWSNDWIYFRCPSIAELLDEIPKSIHIGHHEYTLNITPYNIPNALAEIWLWLKENNYLK